MKRSFAPKFEAIAERRCVFLPIMIILLASLFTVSILEMRIQSAVSDEIAHLPAGYTYLSTGDFRLNPQHPPLVKIISAVPLLFLGPRLDLNDPAWMTEKPDQWVFGLRFLYTNDADRLLFWGRIPIVLFSLLLGIFVFKWARQLYGSAAALFALFLYVFSPDVIAHSHFVTMDLPLSLFFLMTLYFFWKWLKRFRFMDCILTGLFLGCALATKYSAIILLPAMIIILAVRLFAHLPGDSGATVASRRRIACTVLSFFLVIVCALVVVQGFYFFSPDLSLYWKGMRQVNADHNPNYENYLFGNFKRGGWWYYFPLALLVKTPLPTLLFFIASIVAFASHTLRPRFDEIVLLFPSILFMVMTMALADNIGVRYLLPILPPAYIFSARILQLRMKEWIKYGVIVILGVWYLSSSIAIYPDHLAYFNECAGGAANGYKYLDDSNIEWGQDFKRMADYIRKNRIENAYFLTWPGPSASALYYKVQAKDMNELGVDGLMKAKPKPGMYFMNVHMLLRLKLYAQQTGNRNFDWLDLYHPTGRIGYSFFIYIFK